MMKNPARSMFADMPVSPAKSPPTISPELAELSRFLQQGFARRPGEDARWQDPEQGMALACERLRQSCGQRLQERAGPRINRALLAFRIAPQQASWRDLRLVCRGINRPADWAQRRLIDDDRLFASLLTRIDTLINQASRWRACVRALLASRSEIDATTAPVACQRLDDWLQTALQHLLSEKTPPRWALAANPIVIKDL